MQPFASVLLNTSSSKPAKEGKEAKERKPKKESASAPQAQTKRPAKRREKTPDEDIVVNDAISRERMRGRARRNLNATIRAKLDSVVPTFKHGAKQEPRHDGRVRIKSGRKTVELLEDTVAAVKSALSIDTGPGSNCANSPEPFPSFAGASPPGEHLAGGSDGMNDPANTSSSYIQITDAIVAQGMRRSRCVPVLGLRMPSGKITQWNAALSLSCFPQDVVVGQNLGMILDSLDLDKLQETSATLQKRYQEALFTQSQPMAIKIEPRDFRILTLSSQLMLQRFGMEPYTYALCFKFKQLRLEECTMTSTRDFRAQSTSPVPAMHSPNADDLFEQKFADIMLDGKYEPVIQALFVEPTKQDQGAGFKVLGTTGLTSQLQALAGEFVWDSERSRATPLEVMQESQFRPATENTNAPNDKEAVTVLTQIRNSLAAAYVMSRGQISRMMLGLIRWHFFFDDQEGQPLTIVSHWSIKLPVWMGSWKHSWMLFNRIPLDGSFTKSGTNNHMAVAGALIEDDNGEYRQVTMITVKCKKRADLNVLLSMKAGFWIGDIGMQFDESADPPASGTARASSSPTRPTPTPPFSSSASTPVNSYTSGANTPSDSASQSGSLWSEDFSTFSGFSETDSFRNSMSSTFSNTFGDGDRRSRSQRLSGFRCDHEIVFRRDITFLKDEEGGGLRMSCIVADGDQGVKMYDTYSKRSGPADPILLYDEDENCEPECREGPFSSDYDQLWREGN